MSILITGIQIKSNEIETVAFKLNFLPENESPLEPEADIFNRIGSHGMQFAVLLNK